MQLLGYYCVSRPVKKEHKEISFSLQYCSTIPKQHGFMTLRTLLPALPTYFCLPSKYRKLYSVLKRSHTSKSDWLQFQFCSYSSYKTAILHHSTWCLRGKALNTTQCPAHSEPNFSFFPSLHTHLFTELMSDPCMHSTRLKAVYFESQIIFFPEGR